MLTVSHRAGMSCSACSLASPPTSKASPLAVNPVMSCGMLSESDSCCCMLGVWGLLACWDCCTRAARIRSNCAHTHTHAHTLTHTHIHTHYTHMHPFLSIPPSGIYTHTYGCSVRRVCACVCLLIPQSLRLARVCTHMCVSVRLACTYLCLLIPQSLRLARNTRHSPHRL